MTTSPTVSPRPVRAAPPTSDLDSNQDIVGVRWEMVMRARDRAADAQSDSSDVLRQVADRLAKELSNLQSEAESRRNAG